MPQSVLPFGFPFAPGLPAREFALRRERILGTIGPQAHALVQGAPVVRGFHLFRQTNELHYCCGVDVPQAYLLMNGGEGTATLYVAPPKPGGGWPEADAEALRGMSGLDAILPLDALADDLRQATVLYVPHAPAEGLGECRDTLTWAGKCAASPWENRSGREDHLLAVLRALCPTGELRDLTPVLDEMRLVKSEAEIALCREAGRLSARAVSEAMRATRPGLRENHLQAIAEFVYLANGARGESYRSIIASGTNAWDAHYCLNSSKLCDGDLVLMDTAPDYHFYTSDIGRMWPINGRYEPWQRELYGLIVQWHKALLARLRPGVMAETVLTEAREEMAQVVEATRFSSTPFKAAAQRTLDFKGHLSHPVGMAVHDVGDYWSAPLRPGTVFAVDPQLWVPEERLYIRVEDTVLVTRDGVEVLTAGAPLELDETEAIVGQGTDFPL